MFYKFLICILTTYFTISADLAEIVREYFEWGEYSSLIDTLAPRIDSLSKLSDSSVTAYFYSCLGVAYFSTENINDARVHFSKALQFDSSISIPPKFVSNEITALFRAIKSEFGKQNRLKFIEDSLVMVHNYEKEITNKKILAAELKKKHQRILISSIVSSAASAAFFGLSIFQYDESGSVYNDFRRAAESGDQFQYDKLKGRLTRINRIVVTYDVVSGVTFCYGIAAAIKAHHKKKELSGLK
jgi:uncharacterized glyoxalase superfamily protein PhnB